MAALKIAFLFLAICVALNQSLPRRKKGRMERLEETVRELMKESADLRKLRKYVREKFTTKYQTLANTVQGLLKAKWTLHRTKYDFPGLQETTLKGDNRELKSLPTGMIPRNTRAILVAIKCSHWKETFKAQMSLKLKQTLNEIGGETVLTAPMNDFYYEVMVPWDTKYANELGITTEGTSKNVYSISLTGYITA